MLWRKRLSQAERARLQADPESAFEASLTAALANLPDEVVASNFTARVMDAIEREEAVATRMSSSRWNWRWLVPRLVAPAAILLIAGISIQRYEIHAERTQALKNFAMVAASHPLPSVDALENLDAIQRMSQVGHADGELLAALQ